MELQSKVIQEEINRLNSILFDFDHEDDFFDVCLIKQILKDINNVIYYSEIF